MRVLVEQSVDEAKKWIKNLNLEITVDVLMGGVDADEWFLYPEQPAILIGTQDMLLSRALNRGYAASRFHWPIDFGLTEQRLPVGVRRTATDGQRCSTSSQLAGLRKLPWARSAAALRCGCRRHSSRAGWTRSISAGRFPGEPLELDRLRTMTPSGR